MSRRRRTELVSCVLPTRNRPRFFSQALRYFARQTYSEKELVVVDDGDEPVERFCRALLPACHIRYIRLSQPTALGTKMNLGIERARGPVIHKMDDDDYYAPTFLATGLAHLDRRSGPVIAAWDSFLVLLAGERLPRFSGAGWAAGGTFCFARALWRQRPFRDIPRSVDRWFLEDQTARGAALAPVHAPELYMLVRHGTNTWNAMDELHTDEWMVRQPVYAKPLDCLMSAEDAGFYEALRYRGATSASSPLRRRRVRL